MAKLSNQAREVKISYAKDMYVRGMSIEVIADVMGLALRTVKDWAKEQNFEQARQLNSISLSEIRAMILAGLNDIREGRTPKLKPDDASKYASAFEKMSDKSKLIPYMYELFQELTLEYSNSIERSKTASEKQLYLSELKNLRTHMDRVAQKLTQQVLEQ